MAQRVREAMRADGLAPLGGRARPWEPMRHLSVAWKVSRSVAVAAARSICSKDLLATPSPDRRPQYRPTRRHAIAWCPPEAAHRSCIEIAPGHHDKLSNLISRLIGLQPQRKMRVLQMVMDCENLISATIGFAGGS
jgi:hypothetical protein